MCVCMWTCCGVNCNITYGIFLLSHRYHAPLPHVAFGLHVWVDCRTKDSVASMSMSGSFHDSVDMASIAPGKSRYVCEPPPAMSINMHTHTHTHTHIHTNSLTRIYTYTLAYVSLQFPPPATIYLAHVRAGVIIKG